MHNYICNECIIYSVCNVCLWLQYWGQLLKDRYEDDDNIGEEGSGVKDACTDISGVFTKDFEIAVGTHDLAWYIMSINLGIVV